MKLRIRESNEYIVYVDLVRGDCGLDDLHEENLASDEVIKAGSEYTDHVGTRDSLFDYLEPLAKKIQKQHCVESVVHYYPREPDNYGLSNYITITFQHPYGIGKDEVDKYYQYTLRFSDHGHDNAKKDRRIIDSKEVVGLMPKDLYNVGLEIFEDNLDRIVDYIKQHEVDIYGYPKTTL